MVLPLVSFALLPAQKLDIAGILHHVLARSDSSDHTPGYGEQLTLCVSVCVYV